VLRVAVRQKRGLEQVALRGARRKAGRRPYALDVEDHRRRFGVIREAGEFAHRVIVTSHAGEVSSRRLATMLGRAVSRDRSAILVELDSPGGGEENIAGFADLQAGVSSFEEAIQRDRVSRLHVLPGGRGAIEFNEECEFIMDSLARTYEFVFVSLPAMRASDAALDMAPDADVAVLASSGAPNATAFDELSRAGAGQTVSIAVERSSAGRSAA